MGAQYLYRRASGTYFVRLCVPARLKHAVGKGEIHRSTGCRDLRLAKIVAAEIAAHWHRAIEAVQAMDAAKIKAGSISLLGNGFIGLEKAAAELGAAPPADLAARLADRGARFYVDARDWQGWALDSIYDSVEYEHDEFGRASMVLPPRDGVPTVFGGRARIRHREEALQAAEGAARVCQFLAWPSQERGFVVDLPGQLVTSSELLVEREAVESLRDSLASQLRPDATPANAVLSEAAPAGMRFSDLVVEFLKRKKGDWKEDQTERKMDQCRAFQELMGDPLMSEITRPLVRRFSDELGKLPSNRGAVRRRFKCPEAGFRELIDLADTHALARITPDSHRRFMDGISEVFSWAVKETHLSMNPAIGLGMEIQKKSTGGKSKAQDQRDAFSDADLAQIFGAEWFLKGAGTPTPEGRFHSYRPHYYWLPLLALYTGGRLNELAQLYLSDLVEEGGVWYVDFNLNADDKVAADDDANAAEDKSLKTVNAERIVPLHQHLIELGLLQYAAALREAGEVRLFPSCGHDKRKGYGKAAGSWFNERFLGNRLKMERNGRKTFHSFRHNFATALGVADVPRPVKSDLMGHSRSNALVESRYDKGAQLLKLAEYVAALSYGLPAVARFSVKAGMDAVRDALRLKKSHRRQ
ncbi:site-specific integrase [Ramlibacter montanisoli]|uniref:Site-specific integrase n=1 Tax=Ramlibacter montanisoli TaxID=2732512 RepID=A0A849K7V6_9BURK|nr:site-specific integrase [Ramlibacter montanisoli]NNU43590.1 site-specific integrase [Ramlibacter montanisoli]